VDFINLMSYDFHGSWETKTGHHASLKTTDGSLSGSAAVQKYLGFGVPANKIVLGMPLYGRSWTVAKLPPADNKSKNAINSKKTPGITGSNIIGTSSLRPQYKSISKRMFMRRQVKSGVVVPPANTPGTPGKGGKCVPEPGMFTFFDIMNAVQAKQGLIDDSQPQLGAVALIDNQWISFDSLATARAKTDFIKQQGLGGAAMWAIDQDTLDFSFSKTVFKRLQKK
jgi:chitinase